MERRNFIQAVGAIGLMATSMGRAVAQNNSKRLVLSGSGGAVAETTREVYLNPFTAETGIVVDQVPTEQQRLAQLETMVRNNRTSWDVMEISGSDYPIGASRGLFEKIDYSKLDPDNVLPEIAKREYSVMTASYSEVLIMRTDKLPEGRTMQGWADFWDVDQFPGPRSLSAMPKINLEYALIADGVAMDELYNVLETDEGVDRAFKKMDEIKPHIRHFWRSGAEAVQLLTSGEAHFCSNYNGRITSLQQAGVPVEIMWEGGAMYLAGVGMPKGLKNVENAYKYMAYRAMDTERMREYISKLPYPGFAPGLTDGLSEEVASTLPTYEPNLKVQFLADEDFWGRNLDRLQERWNSWMLI